MRRTVLVYASVLAIAVFLLEWLEYRYTIRALSTEAYLVLLTGGFTALGIWVGRRLTPPAPAGGFEPNRAAIAALGITEREYEVLRELARGASNKEIARRLVVSPNTVKTHIAHLYAKLDVSRRTEALNKARLLKLVA